MKLKRLIEELNYMEELNEDYMMDLSMLFNVEPSFVLSLYLEMKKLTTNKVMPTEAIVLFLETELNNARFDYEYYSMYINTLDSDNEALGDIIKLYEKSEQRIKMYEKFFDQNQEPNKTKLK